MEFCLFNSCAARDGGAIYVEGSSIVRIYVTLFISNTATNNDDDINTVEGGTVKVHDTCPPDWSGIPTTGSNLDTDGNPISGTAKNFGQG